MRVLEIGAGTGYNAALIATITGAPVVTLDAGARTVRGAAGSIRRLGLDHQVTVRHGEGYDGDPTSATYDRIIVTCGITGLSPHWISQLASDGLILAPIAHGGVHPIVAATSNQGLVIGKAALWADFMPAAGPLRPAELAGHNPADYIPATALTRLPGASPARTTTAYHDLWFFLATRDPRITRAHADDDSVDPRQGACALHAPPEGTAWVHNDGSISTISTADEPTITDELRHLIHEWDALAAPPLTQFTCTFEQTTTATTPLWTPQALDPELVTRLSLMWGPFTSKRRQLTAPPHRPTPAAIRNRMAVPSVPPSAVRNRMAVHGPGGSAIRSRIAVAATMNPAYRARRTVTPCGSVVTQSDSTAVVTARL